MLSFSNFSYGFKTISVILYNPIDLVQDLFSPIDFMVLSVC